MCCITNRIKVERHLLQHKAVKRVTVCPPLPLRLNGRVCFFCTNRRLFFFFFLFFLMSKTWSPVIQHCRLLLPRSPPTPPPRFLWMCASCWFCIPSQQVDWASVTSYIYIYTCTQHHMYPPNNKKKKRQRKQNKKKQQLPFHHFKCLKL